MLNLKDAIFSVLFVYGEPVRKSALQDAFKVNPEKLASGINELEAMLENLPITLKETEESLCLVTRPEMAEYIKTFKCGNKPVQKLSGAALETLAVIIMKQPCTRQEIEAVRSCECEKTIDTLIKAEAIRPMGNLKLPGSPVLYSVTDSCLYRFGVKSYSELRRVVERAVQAV